VLVYSDGFVLTTCFFVNRDRHHELHHVHDFQITLS